METKPTPSSFRRTALCRAAALFWAVLLLGAGARAEVPRVLFSSDTPIDIEISSETLGDLIRDAEQDTSRHPARMRYTDEHGVPVSAAIELSVRGQTRRKRHVCRFPPLRLYFKDKARALPLFKGHKKLKLVTHCQVRRAAEQNTLIEYVAYRLYNILTPHSYRVRLARITYVNGERTLVTRYGFFIEDTDDVAARNGRVELTTNKVRTRLLDPEVTALMSLYQFMIANLDWSATAVQGDDECCHNVKLSVTPEHAEGTPAGNIPNGAVVPLPYDFDYSGLVDAPYAVVGDGANTKSVTTRLYWGFCRHNDHLPEAIAHVETKRAEVFALIETVEGLKQRTRSQLKRYLTEFFDIIGDPESVERRLVGKCRGRK